MFRPALPRLTLCELWTLEIQCQYFLWIKYGVFKGHSGAFCLLQHFCLRQIKEVGRIFVKGWSDLSDPCHLALQMLSELFKP